MVIEQVALLSDFALIQVHVLTLIILSNYDIASLVSLKKT
jgi:hypothetical protein